MSDHVILVCGFGRCGSSLVMQMLDAGGVPTIGEYPAFEDDRTGLDRDPQWIAAQCGKALKLLDPHYPDGRLIPGNYKIIWLDRDHKQQARSQAKFARLLMGLPIDRAWVRALAGSYQKDLPVALKILQDRGPVLRVRFEDILNDTFNAACRISKHLGIGDVPNMVSQVRRRSPENANGMDMELALIAEREALSVRSTGE